jgi:hypothetical protein
MLPVLGHHHKWPRSSFFPYFYIGHSYHGNVGCPISKGGYSKVDFCEKQYHNEIGLEYKPWLMTPD